MFPRRWFWPFLWVLLVPAISVPISILLQSRLTLQEGAELGLGDGGPWVDRQSALETFSPALLSLGALIWLFLGNGRARWAAFWAGLISAAGAAVPFFVILNTDSVGLNGVHYVYWIPTMSLVWLGAFNTWLAALVAALMFRIYVQARERARALEMAPEGIEPYLSPVHSH
jgi:hypothetical protein